MLTINLTELRFHAHHGLYPEEQLTGNDFELSIAVSFLPFEGIVRELQHSINYVAIYQLAKTRMEQATPLLETVVMELAEAIVLAFPVVQEVKLELKKLTAPIEGINGNVGVQYKWQASSG